MQRDLFGIFKPVAFEDIDSLPDPSFRSWAKRRLKEETLNNILVELIKSGLASNTDDALKLLSVCSASVGLEDRVITLADLGLTPSKRTNLSKLSFYQKGEINPQKHLGNLSHSLMARFCRMQNGVLETPNSQLPLFDYEHENEQQLELEGLANGSFGVDIVEDIRCIWGNASEAIKAPNFAESYFRSVQYVQPLLELIKVYTGVSIKPIFNNADVCERWLFVNAVITWANSLLNLVEGKLPCPMVCEVQACSRELGVSGGRIDGVEFLRRNGDFKNLTGGNADFSSLGQLANHAHRDLGGNGLRIVEWKFAIGDTVKHDDENRKLIVPDEVVQAPFERHRRQVERYLTLGHLDEYFFRKGRFGSGVELWHEPTQITEGLIVYLFPATAPIIHRVALNAEEKREVFVRDIVSHWERAGANTIIRGIDRECLSLFSHRSRVDRETVAPKLLTQDKISSPVSIVRVIDDHRIFLDNYGIVENRGGKYVMHLARLAVCIRSGLIQTSSSFKMPQGGLVCCPVHKEKRPSLSVRPADGYFYCFARSCKISGRLAPGSIPQEIRTDINTESWVRRKDLFKDLFVPDGHHKILEQAHLLLQSEFCDSEGERYVREQRGLDTDLAYEMGAGFGNSKVISALLDLGISLEELKRVGLVRFSSKVSSQRGLCPMLFKRGLKLSEVKREIGKTSDGKPIYGLPYFVLEGRVTLPLKVRERYANIYGRSVRSDARVPHTKLSTEDSGVRHGAFNEEILYSDKCKEVVVTEGVFDAISIKQMFLRDAIAVIGTKNELVVELLVQSGKDVAIALDNDSAGRADTERLKKSFLRSHKFKGRVRDFTQSFIDELCGRELEVRSSGGFDWRDQLGWDDWNTLLIQHGKWLS